MAFVKFLAAATPTGDRAVVRVLTGPDEDHLAYAGSMVLPTGLYENLLDALVFGASSMQFPDGKLQVRFGQDEPPVS